MFGTICDEAVVMAKCTCTACKACIVGLACRNVDWREMQNECK